MDIFTRNIFKIYCNLFINKNINLNETRIFINKHDFHGRNSKCNKDLALSLINKFIKDEINCNNDYIDEIKNKTCGYNYESLKNLSDDKIKEILNDIIDNKYGYKRNIANFDYKINNEIFKKYINNVDEKNIDEYNKIFNNDILPKQKHIFIKYLNSTFNFNCLIGSYLKNYCDLICSNLHINNVSKKSLHRYIEKNKFVCEYCNKPSKKLKKEDDEIEIELDSDTDTESDTDELYNENKVMEIKDIEVGAIKLNNNTVKYKNTEYKIKEGILTDYLTRGYILYPVSEVKNVNDILPYKCKCGTFYNDRKVKNVLNSAQCIKCRKYSPKKVVENKKTENKQIEDKIYKNYKLFSKELNLKLQSIKQQIYDLNNTDCLNILKEFIQEITE